MFSGCSLVQRNTEKYLNRTVASFGDEQITKQDLVSAYNNYGYQYVQNYGYTKEKAVSTVLDGLIDRKILLEKAKKYIVLRDDGTVMYYADGDQTKEGKLLLAKNVWQNAVWTSVFDSVNSQIESLESTIKKELGIEEKTATEDAKTDFDPFKEYEKKVSFENGTWSIIKEDSVPQQNALSVGDFVQNANGSQEIAQKAFKRYVKQLELAYKDRNLTIEDTKLSEQEFDATYADLDLTKAQKIAFVYELNRLQDVYTENKYVTEFQNAYEYFNQTIDASFNKSIVSKYKSQVLSSYDFYASLSEEQAYKKYFDAMQDDPSKVYYHGYKNKSFATTEMGFAKVAHILIKISDEQVAELDALKKQKGNGTISDPDYQQQYDALISRFETQAVAYARDSDGNNITDTMYSVSDIYAEINQALSQASTLEQKAEVFNNFIYKYGQDTGSINASHYYACNMRVDDDYTDKLVTGFANKSRALAKSMPDGGNWSQPVFVNQDNYSGFHIILNLGIYDNPIVSGLTKQQIENMDKTPEMVEKYAEKLYETRIMEGVDKSYYDSLYDDVFSSNFSNFENSLIETEKQNIKITYYVDAYKDLY